MLPRRPSGRWTISAKTASGRHASSRRRWSATRRCRVVVGVAEAAQQPGARRARRAVDEQPEVAAVDGRGRAGDQGGHHLEGVGQRRAVRASVQGGEVARRRDGARSSRARAASTTWARRNSSRGVHAVAGSGGSGGKSRPASRGDAACRRSGSEPKPTPSSSSSASTRGTSRSSNRTTKASRKRVAGRRPRSAAATGGGAPRRPGSAPGRRRGRGWRRPAGLIMSTWSSRARSTGAGRSSQLVRDAPVVGGGGPGAGGVDLAEGGPDVGQPAPTTCAGREQRSISVSSGSGPVTCSWRSETSSWASISSPTKAAASSPGRRRRPPAARPARPTVAPRRRRGVRRCAGPRSRAVAVLDRDQVVRAQRPVDAGLGVAPAAAGPVEARVRAPPRARAARRGPPPGR